MDISEVLFRAWRKSLVAGERASAAWESLKNRYSGEVPRDVELRFTDGPGRDLVLENLRTHDWQTLAKKLQPKFGINFVEADSKLEDGDKRQTFFIRVKGTKEHPFFQLDDWIKQVVQEPEVKRDIDFYNYTFRGIGNVLGDSTKYVWFEPKFTESADDFIYNDCHGVVYRIIPKSTLSNVLQNGLRCRENGKWKGKIYVWAHEPQKMSRTLQDLKDFAEKMYEDTDNPPDWDKDLAVIQIQLVSDLYSHKIPFYRDTAMESNAFYTYTHIPPEFIKKVIKN